MHGGHPVDVQIRMFQVGQRKNNNSRLFTNRSQMVAKVHDHTQAPIKSVFSTIGVGKWNEEGRGSEMGSPLYPRVHANQDIKGGALFPRILQPITRRSSSQQPANPRIGVRLVHQLSSRNTPYGFPSSRGGSPTCVVTFTKTASGRESGNRTSRNMVSTYHCQVPCYMRYRRSGARRYPAS
jgi:hypothetical protein